METKIEKIEKNFKLTILMLIYMIISFLCFIMFKKSIFILIVLILFFMGIFSFLKYINEKIIISNDGIKHINLFKKEKNYLWNELSVRKFKKQYTKNSYAKPIFFRKYELKDEYEVYFNGTKILNSTGEKFNSKLKDCINFAIKNGKLKEEKSSIDGNEVIALKSNSFPLLINLVMFIIFLCINLILFIGLMEEFNIGIFIFACICIILEIYYFISLIGSFKQIIQKIYYIKKQGFYKIIFGIKKYYDFKEIDKCVTKKYFCLEPVEYEMKLYKENKKILTLNNSQTGFYDFLDEIENK